MACYETFSEDCQGDAASCAEEEDGPGLGHLGEGHDLMCVRVSRGSASVCGVLIAMRCDAVRFDSIVANRCVVDSLWSLEFKMS